jgi:hypothetical protein
VHVGILLHSLVRCSPLCRLETLTDCCATAVQAVAVQGAHKHYQLQQADLTCSSLDELTVYNIRRLFALKVRG